jgi:hypothetical protein
MAHRTTRTSPDMTDLSGEDPDRTDTGHTLKGVRLSGSLSGPGRQAFRRARKKARAHRSKSRYLCNTNARARRRDG